MYHQTLLPIGSHGRTGLSLDTPVTYTNIHRTTCSRPIKWSLLLGLLSVNAVWRGAALVIPSRQLTHWLITFINLLVIQRPPALAVSHTSQFCIQRSDDDDWYSNLHNYCCYRVLPGRHWRSLSASVYCISIYLNLTIIHVLHKLTDWWLTDV